MPFSAQFQALGSFSVTLKPSAPREVRLALGQWDTVIITPGRMGRASTSLASLLSASVFTGVLLEQTLGGPTDRTVLAGPSILYWLGDQSGKGSDQYGSYAGTTTLGVHLIAFDAVRARTNGWDIGTTTGISGNSITDAGNGKESSRSVIERLCSMTTTPTEYYAKPNGVIDFTPSGTYTIFTGDSVVVIGRDLAKERRDWLVWPIVDLSVTQDWSEFANIMHTTDGTNSSTIANASGKTFDASTDAYMAQWEQLTTSTANTTDLDTYGTRQLATKYATRYKYQLEVDGDLMPDTLAPGARIYLFDPWTNQVDNTNRIVLQGRQISPTRVRVMGMRCGITEGMGVYGVNTNNASATVTDLTDHVDYSVEPRTTTLDLVNRQERLTGIVRQ